jgi:tripartite-type tricarboxylate transporter receptor subunit TctC
LSQPRSWCRRLLLRTIPRGRSGSTWHSAGGAANIVARLVAQPLSTRLDQPAVVENKPGSGGNIAGELFARAGPDSYSLRALPVCRALKSRRFFILAS